MSRRQLVSVFFQIVLPMVALVAGGLITLHLLKTSPQARPFPKKKSATLVETMAVSYGSHATSITAMGVVKAAQSIELKSQVGGEVIGLSEHFVPGGYFSRNDQLLQLDPRDFQLTLRQQQSALEQAKTDLQLENGSQLVAQRELVLLGEKVSEEEKSLMLRQPQLKSLQNALDVAEAKVEQAQLNLSRTSLVAPFNGVVQSRDVNVGTFVSSSNSLATLIGTDVFWVEVSVPQEQLEWIEIPGATEEAGATVKIYNPSAWKEQYRKGRVIRLHPALETEGRMARLLIEVKDPLALEPDNRDKPQLLIDSFVRMEIEGKPISSSFELSRQYLHEGNSLWLFGGDGSLDIRRVNVAFKSWETVLITGGVKAGEQLIVSSLPAPVGGMPLRLVGAADQEGLPLETKDRGGEPGKARPEEGGRL